MSDELRMPPVIDFEALLQPISEESPSGENLRYSGIYDEIAEARRADEALEQGDWKTDLKAADYQKVLSLGIPALIERGKDLQIAVWVAESLSKVHGFAGVRDSLLLISRLQDTFWDTLHPEIDEGDMEGRANAVSWLDEQFPIVIRAIPITGGSGYSYNDWEDSRRFDIPDNLDAIPSDQHASINALKAQAEKERRVTSALWAREKAATRRDPVERVNLVLEECWGALAELNRVIDEKYDRNQMPGLSNFSKALDNIHTQVKVLLEEKRLEEPDPIEEAEAEADASGEPGESASAGSGDGVAKGAINNRTDALRRLAEIAAYFQRTEPHSPVSYLVQRAVKWGSMGLESWLQEVIKDQSVLFQLRETLGVDAGGAPNGDDPWVQE